MRHAALGYATALGACLSLVFGAAAVSASCAPDRPCVAFGVGSPSSASFVQRAARLYVEERPQYDIWLLPALAEDGTAPRPVNAAFQFVDDVLSNSTLPAPAPTVLPVLAGAFAPVFLLDDVIFPAGQSLVVTAGLTRRILEGEIRLWNDSAIVALNPALAPVGRPIRVLLAEQTYATAMRMLYAAEQREAELEGTPAAAAAALPSQAAAPPASAAAHALPGATVLPTDLIAVLRMTVEKDAFAVVLYDVLVQQGRQGLAARMLDPTGTPPALTVSVDAMRAAANSAARAAAALDAPPAGVTRWRTALTPELAPCDEGAWPLTFFSSVLLLNATLPADRCGEAEAAADFARWLVTAAAVRNRAPSVGHAPLPSQVAGLVASAVESLTCNGAPLVRTVTTVQGSGSSLAFEFFDEAAFLYGAVESGAAITYRGTGSSAGIRDMINGATTFGGTEAALTAEAVAQNLTLFPVIAGAVAIAYNVQELGGDAPDLLLDRSTLVGIFRGTIATWNDPALVALNPNLTLPARPIKVVARSDGSGTTSVVKDALGKMSQNFTAEVSTNLADSSWPERLAGRLLRGPQNIGVAARVASTADTLGYVVAASARGFGLRTAQMRNLAGAVVSPDIGALRAAMGAFAGADESSHVSITDAADPRAWPLSGYAYVIARPAVTAASCAPAVESARFFLWMFNSSAVAGVAEQLGFALPSADSETRVVNRIFEFRCNGARLVGECAQGSVFAPELRSCVPCPVNTFAPVTAAGELSARACVPCPVNTFQPSVGQTQCTERLCPAGATPYTPPSALPVSPSQAAPASGSAAIIGPIPVPGVPGCAYCEADTYKDREGNGECSRCPAAGAARTTTNGVVGADNALECLCPAGFFAVAAPVAPAALQAMEAALRQQGAEPSLIDVGQGKHCLRCPRGAVCEQLDLGLADVPARPGFWRGHPNSTFFEPCPVPQQCLGGAVQRVEDSHRRDAFGWEYATRCARGSDGPLCGECTAGWGRGGPGSPCDTCPAGASAIALYGAFILGFVSFVAYTTHRRVKTKRMRAESVRMSNNVKVLLTFLQVNGFLGTFGFAYTNSLRRLWSTQRDSMSMGLMSALGSCIYSPDGSIFAQQFASAAGALGAAIVICAVFVACERRIAARFSGSSKSVDAVLCITSLLVFLTYPSALQQAFSGLACKSLPSAEDMIAAPDDTPLVLVVDSRVRCSGSFYAGLTAGTVSLAALLVVGVPLFVIFIVRRNRDFIVPDRSHRAQRMVLDQRAIDELRRQVFAAFPYSEHRARSIMLRVADALSASAGNLLAQLGGRTGGAARRSATGLRQGGGAAAGALGGDADAGADGGHELPARGAPQLGRVPAGGARAPAVQVLDGSDDGVQVCDDGSDHGADFEPGWPSASRASDLSVSTTSSVHGPFVVHPSEAPALRGAAAPVAHARSVDARLGPNRGDRSVSAQAGRGRGRGGGGGGGGAAAAQLGARGDTERARAVRGVQNPLLDSVVVLESGGDGDGGGTGSGGAAGPARVLSLARGRPGGEVTREALQGYTRGWFKLLFEGYPKSRWQDLLLFLRFLDAFEEQSFSLMRARGASVADATLEASLKYSRVLKTQRRWGFIYRSYTPQRSYWEVVVFGRKIGMALSAVIALGAYDPANPQGSYLGMPILVMVVALLANMLARPYSTVTVAKARPENQMLYRGDRLYKLRKPTAAMMRRASMSLLGASTRSRGASDLSAVSSSYSGGAGSASGSPLPRHGGSVAEREWLPSSYVTDVGDAGQSPSRRGLSDLDLPAYAAPILSPAPARPATRLQRLSAGALACWKSRRMRAVRGALRRALAVLLHLPLVWSTGLLDTLAMTATLVSLVLGLMSTERATANLAGESVNLGGDLIGAAQVLVQFGVLAMLLLVILVDAMAVWKIAVVVDVERHAHDAQEYVQLLKKHGLEGVREPRDADILAMLLARSAGSAGGGGAGGKAPPPPARA